MHLDCILVREESGGFHLTPRKDTRWIVADGKAPLAKAMLESGIKNASITDTDLTKLSKQTNRDFKTGPAFLACIGDASLAEALKDDDTEVLMEMPSTLLALEDPDQVCTKGGERV